MKLHSTLVAVALLGSACRKDPLPEPRPPGTDTAGAHDDEGPHEVLPRVVKLSAEVVKEAGVEVAPAQRRRLAATVELNGQVAPDPDRVALLGARVQGRVLKVLVREGDTVTAGQPLAVLTSPELAKKRSEHTGAAARASAARRNAERLRTLLQQRLTSEQDVLAAEAEARVVEADRDAAQQAIRGMGATPTTDGDPAAVTVVAPIAGQVVQRDAVSGQVLEPGHTLFTVADLSQLWFLAQLFEKDLGSVHEGAQAELRLNGYPHQVFPAKVMRVSSQVDPSSRTLTARLQISERSQALRLGLFGVARVSIGEGEGLEQVVVPLSAVTEIGERKVVFVRHPDGDFEVHDVTLGPSASGHVAVLSGLDAGEQVVIAGVHTLKSVVLKSTLGEGD